MGALSKRQKDGHFGGYNPDFLQKTEITKYVGHCCKYTWKLVCQTPPYLMEGNFSLEQPVVFNSAAHQLCRDVPPSRHTVEHVKCVVWPGLFVNNGSSERVIRKTEVLLRWKSSFNAFRVYVKSPLKTYDDELISGHNFFNHIAKPMTSGLIDGFLLLFCHIVSRQRVSTE